MHAYIHLGGHLLRSGITWFYIWSTFAPTGCIKWHLGGFLHRSTSCTTANLLCFLPLSSVHVLQLPGKGCAPSLLFLLHPARGFWGVSTCPILPHAIWPFRVSPAEACWDTSRDKLREGAVADWSIHACCYVICTTAEVAQAAQKVLTIPYLTFSLGMYLKPILTQINRLLHIDVFRLLYSIQTDYIQQWWKLHSAQEYKLECCREDCFFGAVLHQQLFLVSIT